MEAQQSDIRDGHNPPVQLCEATIREFQDAVSQNLVPFYKRAYRYMGDSHDAEDAVQDALLSAYKHLDQFKGSEELVNLCVRSRNSSRHKTLEISSSAEPDFGVFETPRTLRPKSRLLGKREGPLHGDLLGANAPVHLLRRLVRR